MHSNDLAQHTISRNNNGNDLTANADAQIMTDQLFKELNIGDTAPDFTAASTNGHSFRLYDELKKGQILLNFYIGDFGINCTIYMTKMIEMASRFEEMGVRIFPINPDSLESHRQWKDRMNSPYDHLFDQGQGISKEYGAIVKESTMVKGFTNREFFLIDSDRKIQYIWRAPMPKILPDMEEIFNGVSGAQKTVWTCNYPTGKL